MSLSYLISCFLLLLALCSFFCPSPGCYDPAASHTFCRGNFYETNYTAGDTDVAATKTEFLIKSSILEIITQVLLHDLSDRGEVACMYCSPKRPQFSLEQAERETNIIAGFRRDFGTTI